MYNFIPFPDIKLTKVQQIVRAIIIDIEKGVLEKNYQLPSINEFSKKYFVARDTIEKAYGQLKTDGFITSVKGKGYFVLGKKVSKLKVLLVFNKLSTYKKIIYDNIVETFGEKATIDLQIHHYNPRLLKEIIETVKEDYHYYIIMPHFFLRTQRQEYLHTLRKIPEKKLLLLDNKLAELEGNYMAVYQDFKNDIYEALILAIDLLNKYKRIILVFPMHSNHPLEITQGALQFCNEHEKEFIVTDNAPMQKLKKGDVYIIISDSDLATIMTKLKVSGLTLGNEVGIISFNETVLKELIDITVITTDFKTMGRTAAKMILNRTYEKVKNPFKIIHRGSL